MSLNPKSANSRAYRMVDLPEPMSPSNRTTPSGMSRCVSSPSP